MSIRQRSAGTVEYSLSGAVAARVDGATVPLGGPKQRCVLAVLLAHHGTVVSIDRLIDAIWADEAPAKALASLRSYVANLRKVLTPATDDGTARLASRPNGYQLNLLPGDSVDLHEFEALVLKGRAQLVGADAEGAFASLSQALQRWRGDPFGEFLYRDFAIPEARRYSALQTTAIEARFDAAVQYGRGAQIIPEIEAAVAHDPLQERLWGHLMLALTQAGRPADAVRAFDRVGAVLKRELGVRPGEGLQTLFEKIGDGSADPLSTTSTTAPELPLPPLYVGRDSATDAVTASVNRIRFGTGGLTLVTGESGIGKTSLAQAVAERTGIGEIQVVWAGHPTGIRLPLMWTWIQVLRQLGTDLGSAGRHVVRRAAPGVVDALVPEWGDDDVGAAVADLPQRTAVAATGFALAEGITGALRELSALRPLLLILDDLHHADTASLQALTLLTTQLARVPIHVIGTWTYFGADRPVNRKALTRLLHSSSMATVPLGGIDRTAAHQLIHTVSGAPARSEVTESVWRQSGGNPFYIKEIARGLGADEPTDGVPDAVLGVVGRRLGTLDRPTRRTLGAAAVIGPVFDVAALADVVDLSVSAVQARLRPAYETGLLDEVPGQPGAYRFSHGLVRDAVLAHLSTTERTAAHASIATTRAAAIASDAYEDAIAGADHAWQAGAALNPDTALEISETVIERALSRSAYDDIAVLAEHALQIATRLPAKPEYLARQATLWMHLAGAKGILEGQTSSAVTHAIARAFEIGEQVRGRSFYGAVALQCFARIGMGHTEEAAVLAHGLREQYLRSGDPDAGLASDFTQVMVHFVRGDTEAAIATGQHMMENFPPPETVTDPLHFVHPRVYCWMAIAEAQRGNTVAMDDYRHLARELAQSRGDTFNILASELTQVECAAILGVTAGTAAAAAEVDRKLCAAGGHQWAACARIISIWAEVMETGVDHAPAAFEAFDEFAGDGSVAMHALFLALLADIEQRVGRPGSAREILTRARTLTETTGEHSWDDFIDRRVQALQR
ncbi:AAA family ATPase [Mycolicibacterium fluoranthenivorans]|uniref:AAA family ATPase n=1 Tax=Mycolicibacterium fluoranthenivorans TaxID=258505 RepID=A0A7G8PE19_9MYCO|nr:BTAD domain-containing putative transcriptional regulator [Mycolicibacterium fluoranthenivorans]QNJ92585.1 AAA family ATPase [Mycolicibacterium fluoranthenivorans]